MPIGSCATCYYCAPPELRSPLLYHDPDHPWCTSTGITIINERALRECVHYLNREEAIYK